MTIQGGPWPDHALIRYSDARGDITERGVLVRRIYPQGDVAMLQGICSLRRVLRAFRSDRIVWMADPSSGEVFKDIDGALRASPLFDPHPAKRAAKPFKPRQSVDGPLNALGYLASLTHGFGPEKRDILVEFVERVMKVQPAQRDSLLEYVSILDPELDDALTGLEDAADEDKGPPFMVAAAKLITLDHKVAPLEADFLREYISFCRDVEVQLDIDPMLRLLA